MIPHGERHFSQRGVLRMEKGRELLEKIVENGGRK
jgi:hypothetical protein